MVMTDGTYIAITPFHWALFGAPVTGKPYRRDPLKELAIALLTWISSHTPLAYDGTHAPEIVVVPKAQLVHVLYEGNVPQGTDASSLTVDGLYNFRDGKIYLRDELDLATVDGRAVLVHELVHYLQYYHGLDKKAPCMRKLEPEAYAAQAAYLKEHGQEPPFNELLVFFVSLCSSAPM